MEELNNGEDKAIENPIPNKKSNIMKHLKKALPFVLVAVLGFILGFGTDRIITRRNNKLLRQRPGINRTLPKNSNRIQNGTLPKSNQSNNVE